MDKWSKLNSQTYFINFMARPYPSSEAVFLVLTQVSMELY